ncbi:MAG: glycoside hydrolase family 95 protein [Porphyromonadaceae bacterium]|nr:glycoside hydrolase family 95 protein [Porphyromonadaceae bacterium]
MEFLRSIRFSRTGRLPALRWCICLSALLFVCLGETTARNDLKLRYDKPASEWVEALPVGNGRLGAMIFGGVADELIQLNESSLWSSGPRQDNLNSEAPNFLPLIREAIFSGDFSAAAEGCKVMQGPYSASYLPLGDLRISYRLPRAKATGYSRELDISTALSSTRFTIAGTTYEREIFVSAPDRVLAIHLTASSPHALSLQITLSSPLHYALERVAADELAMQGTAPVRIDPDYYTPTDREPMAYEENGHSGMRFRTALKATAPGGEIRVDSTGMYIDGANEVLLLLSVATSFNGYDKYPDTEGIDEKATAEEALHKAANLSYKSLKKRHTTDYKNLFDRFSLSLGEEVDSLQQEPTDRRLLAYTQGRTDTQLECLYFQYGRYLLISSSRPGGPPANLQGIWNPYLQAPWSSNYTLNINTEMNYWPAEVTSLPEMHEALLDWIAGLAQTGTKTAWEYYRCAGWTAHQNSDIWAMSNTVGEKTGDPSWANWYMGGNWLCRHLYEHFAYTRDKEFLREKAYPLMKAAARFTLDWLVEREGYLLTVPSTSPENLYRIDGKEVALTMGSTMDMSIIRDLFSHLIEASTVLGIDSAFRDTLEQACNRLYPLRIGSHGEILEWYDEYEETDPHHRHVSQLFGLYPGTEISPLFTPRYAEAARRTLERRGDGGTGWSKAWKINFWARLLDGNHAYQMIRSILTAVGPGTPNAGKGGTYPNLFDSHPPFQIDGNFGATAGMTEMLLQSQEGELHLLPALPDAWSSGEVSGLKGRNGFDLSLSWHDGRITKGTIRSLAGESCTIRSASPLTIKGAKISVRQEGDYFLYTFPTQAGHRYSLSAGKALSTNENRK